MPPRRLVVTELTDRCMLSASYRGQRVLYLHSSQYKEFYRTVRELETVAALAEICLIATFGRIALDLKRQRLSTWLREQRASFLKSLKDPEIIAIDPLAEIAAAYSGSQRRSLALYERNDELKAITQKWIEAGMPAIPTHQPNLLAMATES